MRKNASTSRARSGSPMWCNTAEHCAQKSCFVNPTSYNVSHYPLRSIGGQSNRFAASQSTAPRLASNSPQRRRLLNSKKNVFLASTTRPQAKQTKPTNRPQAPYVVDMQLPIHSFEASRLNQSPRLSSSMGGNKQEKKLTTTLASSGSKDMLHSSALPVIMLNAHTGRRRPVKTAPIVQKKYSSKSITSKQEATVEEQRNRAVNRPTEPEEAEDDSEAETAAVDEIESQSQTAIEEAAHYEALKTNDLNNTLKQDRREFRSSYPTAHVNVHEEIETEVGLVASCEVTESQYISFGCDELNAEDLDLRQGSFWKPPSAYCMSSFMSPGQLGKTSCMNEAQPAGGCGCGCGCRQGQFQSPSSSKSNYSCNNCGRNRATRMQQPEQQIQPNAMYGNCCRQAPSMPMPMPMPYQVPLQGSLNGLTETLAQQLQRQMKQAQAHIDHIQMQLNRACAAKGMPESKCANSSGCSLQTRDPEASASLPADINETTPIETASGSAEAEASPVLALGFFAMNDEHTQQTPYFSAAALAQQQQRLYMPQQNPMAFAQQQQFLQQQQQQPPQPQLPGNQHRQPCCQQRYAKMRFMMPRCWQGGS